MERLIWCTASAQENKDLCCQAAERSAELRLCFIQEKARFLIRVCLIRWGDADVREFSVMSMDRGIAGDACKSAVFIRWPEFQSTDHFEEQFGISGSWPGQVESLR
ncbi:hypothetical protein OIU77_016289 [Salix suchowensis]|uniref:Uncharacterized protein n=1 Tax=Salix suchowensis TaxID=1278906 RepID=A0ABQ8ZK34_9ROSI|nr:hypothetical protein OIU77_016289 [Salix suchowensis]